MGEDLSCYLNKIQHSSKHFSELCAQDGRENQLA